MAHGVIHWEIGGRDLDSLSEFYRTLFGWEPASFDEDYRLVTPDDGLGGGFMRCRGDMPPYVTVYVEVEDVSATLATVERAGGEPLVPPTPIPGVGTFALFQDPEGNTIGLLQTGPDTAPDS